jgi:hypothetical protein
MRPAPICRDVVAHETPLRLGGFASSLRTMQPTARNKRNRLQRAKPPQSFRQPRRAPMRVRARRSIWPGANAGVACALAAQEIVTDACYRPRSRPVCVANGNSERGFEQAECVLHPRERLRQTGMGNTRGESGKAFDSAPSFN